MGEIVKFVHRGAARVTPSMLKGIHKAIPLLKLEFASIDDPIYPHLPEQLQFLADVVEDFLEGEAEDLPYVTIASAAFALIYAHRQHDLIPDSIETFGHADDSAVVRAVLIEHERALADHAQKARLRWESLSLQP